VIGLLDVNMLVALFDAAHVHHGEAQAWMTANQGLGWATCPIVQNSCIRVLSQPMYPGHLPVAEVARRVRNATSASRHVFWPDDLRPTDADRFRHEHVLSPRFLTDVYLFGLAVQNGGRLVTFDRAISLSAVTGAESKHLVALTR